MLLGELDIFVDHVDHLIGVIHKAQPACRNLCQLMSQHSVGPETQNTVDSRSEEIPRQEKFVSIIDTAKLDDKKDILGELIEKIIVKEIKGEFDIMWNF